MFDLRPYTTPARQLATSAVASAFGFGMLALTATPSAALTAAPTCTYDGSATVTVSAPDADSYGLYLFRSGSDVTVKYDADDSDRVGASATALTCTDGMSAHPATTVNVATADGDEWTDVHIQDPGAWSGTTITITDPDGGDASWVIVVGTSGNELIDLGSLGFTLNLVDMNTIGADGVGGNDTIFLAPLSGAVEGLAYGGSGDDALFGSSMPDFLYAEDGDDTVTGGASNDLLFGGTGADSLSGGEGDDQLFGSAGSDSLIGGAGTDTVSYYDTGCGVVANLDGAIGDGCASEDDVIASDVENLTGGSGNDTLFGDAGPNSLVGGNGADSLYGEEGDDSLVGGFQDDALFGGTGSDSLNGGDGFDSLHGQDGDDALIGGLAPDTLVGGPGGDTLSGGANTDVLSYADMTCDLTVTVGSGDADDGCSGEGDTVGGDVENVIGGSGNDDITGSVTANVISGNDGDDTISGGGGDDFLRGDAGADTLVGGDGTDWADYSLEPDSVTINLDRDRVRGEAAGDVLLEVENILGTPFRDRLIGDSANNVLQGGAGDDTLWGGDGDDALVGDDGTDSAVGGDGANDYCDAERTRTCEA
ncbi:MAG: calcium-binding protein [Actinomycetota bacterium]